MSLEIPKNENLLYSDIIKSDIRVKMPNILEILLLDTKWFQEIQT